ARAAPAAAAAAARGDARGGGAAARARPGRPRRVPARRSRGSEDRPQDPVAVRLVRPRLGLCPGQGAQRAGRAHGSRPHGDDARDGDRAGLGAARRQARLDRAARLPAGPRRRPAKAFGARLELRRSARARAAGQGGNPAGGHVRSAALAAGACMSRPDELVRAVEAALFAAEEPLTVEQLSTHLGGAEVREALATLETHYAERGVRLVERGKRWQFQTAPDLAHLLRREREQVRKLSRAATEVLAIIAYHEPVSRAEIESIRGVQTSPGTLDVLMEAGWVRVAGRREVPGRPVIYATTPEFLSHFGL